MPRTKSSTSRRKRKKRLLKQAKGFKWNRKNLYRKAKEALMKAWDHAYRDRKRKKREFRKLWQTQINAAVRQHDMNYSTFIHGLKEANIELNRKMLADLAKNKPETFEEIVDEAKEALEE